MLVRQSHLDLLVYLLLQYYILENWDGWLAEEIFHQYPAERA